MKGQKTKDSLGDRMKLYEGAYRNYLPRRLPVIIRIDGCHFHTFTRGLKKPFDKVFIETMLLTTKSLCENIMGCKFGYTQSDEISLLLTNNDTFETQPWFDNNINKIVSVSASMASMFFNKYWIENVEKFYIAGVLDDYNKAFYNGKANTAYFDARVFVVPPHEVNNYFIWRQQDATRNSILGCAQSLFSHKEIEGINTKLLQDKMLRLGVSAYKPVVDGKMLIEHGFLPGKDFKEMLDEAYDLGLQGYSEKQIIRSLKKKYE